MSYKQNKKTLSSSLHTRLAAEKKSAGAVSATSQRAQRTRAHIHCTCRTSGVSICCLLYLLYLLELLNSGRRGQGLARVKCPRVRCQTACLCLSAPFFFFLLYLPENCFDSADPDLSGHVRAGHLTLVRHLACATPRICDYEVSVVFEDGVPEPVEVAAGQRERE